MNMISYFDVSPEYIEYNKLRTPDLNQSKILRKSRNLFKRPPSGPQNSSRCSQVVVVQR